METKHPPEISDHLLRMARIPSPWRMTKYSVDQAAFMVHIWVTRHPPSQLVTKRNWLGIATTLTLPVIAETGAAAHWRHLNCMSYSCMVHTADKLDERHHELPWFGQPGLPFTNQLSRQIFVCMMEGMDLGAICQFFNITFTDLWKFKYALDSGHVKIHYEGSKRVSRTFVPAPAAAQGDGAPVLEKAAAADGVPDATHHVWELLVTGGLNIEIKTLSFQLLLSKLRQQVSMQQSDDVKLMKLRELHRYVERNERHLRHELEQLRAHAVQSESK